MTYPVRDRDAQHPRQARRWLTTPDGVRIDSVLLRGTRTRTSAVVLANGFTGTWRSPHTSDRRPPAGRRGRPALRLPRPPRLHRILHCRRPEVIDLQTAVDHLRPGVHQIATLGFSMGAAVAVRHAGLFGGVNAVVAVSGPSRWFYQGTTRMRLLTFGVTRPAGRLLLRLTRNVRVLDRPWDPVPLDPTELAGAVAPAGLLVVHGDADPYFPVEHARRIHEAAQDPRELWIEPGMGHAERAVAVRPDLVDRLASWLSLYLAATL